MKYLIEESACKEDRRTRLMHLNRNLWKWLDSDGPIISADGELNETTRTVTFRSPFGVVQIPEEVLSEDMNHS